ncbi:unnamed protein product, partial [Rotaria sp. Silwood2]
MTIKNLGSIVMEQMIKEVKCLVDISFKTSDYPRLYFVYDPYFALQLLHNDWSKVPDTLKIELWENKDPKEGKELWENKDPKEG